MINTPYRCGLLHPAPRSAQDHLNNDALLGPRTLGIEVTIPDFAARCGLGNIDPQHDGGDDPRAAIEVCLDYPLPRTGATLVTIRPDIDALGGMALLLLRADGQALPGAGRARVQMVAAQDRFARGAWPGVRPLPQTWEEFLELQEGGAELAGLAACVADHRAPVADRIRQCAAWLMEGAEPGEYGEAVTTRARALCTALQDGAIQVRAACDGRAAIAEGVAEGAIRLGYCRAPVLIGLHPRFRFAGGEPHRKFTICQHEAGYLDLPAVVAELNRMEPGWGGSRTIVGSPQGSSSILSIEEVTAVVARHLLDSKRA